MNKRVLGFLVMAALALSTPALAAIDKGDGEIGFDYGSTQLDSDTGFNSATSLGLRGGYFFKPSVELEGQFSSSSDTVDVSGNSVDGTFRMYMVNGVYNFNAPHQVVPYVMAGVGMMDDQVKEFGASVSDSSSAFQVGAGSRFFIGSTKTAAFRIDLSMVQESTFDQVSTHKNVSAGFSWKLGGK
jgi:opacity protein-like surface antigen